MSKRILHLLEVVFLVAGVALLVLFTAAHLDSFFASRAAIHSLETAAEQRSAVSAQKRASFAAALREPDQVDFSLWAPGRIRAYRKSLLGNHSHPLAILRIPRIHLTVPLFDGTDDLTLNRGVGRIEGTALPGESGNLGIAGHRDGFFRGLKDVSRGDVVELVTLDETSVYVIDRTEIVTPKDVSVLSPRPAPSLTLVTCYPFYYIGSAPKRYVVEASLKSEVRNNEQPSRPLRRDASQGETKK